MTTPPTHWTTLSTGLDASGLEKLAVQAGVELTATQISNRSPDITVFVRKTNDVVFSATKIAAPVGLEWVGISGSINFAICVGEAQLMLEGRERRAPSILVYSEPRVGGTWAGQLAAATPGGSHPWTYDVSLPIEVGLSLGLPAQFIKRSWFEFSLELNLAETFTNWAQKQLTMSGGDPDLQEEQLLEWIRKLLSPILAEPVEPISPSHYPRLIRDVCALARTLDEPISVARLAREVDVSTRTLQRAFRSTFGIGVKRYLRIRQLRRAHDLLQSGRYSVTGAALSVGMPHASRFSREYFEHFGVRPSDTLAQPVGLNVYPS